MEKETQTENNGDKIPSQNVPSKKRGLLKMIKVAIFILRRKSTSSKSSSLWKRIVNAMSSFSNDQLPLHIDNTNQYNYKYQIPPPLPPPPPPLLTNTKVGVDLSNDIEANVVCTQQGQDSPMSGSCMSQYASALNLQDLERGCGGGGGGGDGEILIDSDGDEMIDARADEFIAHFYEQMRLQRMKSFDLYMDKI